MSSQPTTHKPQMKTQLRKIPNGQSVVLSASKIESAITGVVAVFADANGFCVVKYSDGHSESANCPGLAAAIRNYFTGAAEDAPSMFHCVSTIQSAARAVAV